MCGKESTNWSRLQLCKCGFYSLCVHEKASYEIQKAARLRDNVRICGCFQGKNL